MALTKNHLLLVAQLIAAPALLGGCAALPEEETGASASNLYVNTANLWMQGVVPVCWEPRTAALTATGITETQFTSIQQSIRNHVRDSWEGASALKTTGWGNCTSGFQGIHVIPDTSTGGSASGIGPASNGNRTIWIGFQATGDQLRYVAVHEFGHALGFYHEQNDPNAPEECRESIPQGEDRSIVIGGFSYPTYDPNSVMNYCGPNNGLLTASDVRGAQAFYGANWGTFVAPTSARCLDVAFASAADGASVGTYDCRFQNNQEWTWSGTGGRMFSGPLRGLAGRCLTRTTSGTLTENTCNGGTNQLWSMAAFEIRGPGGTCLDVDRNPGAGNRVNFYRCNGGDNQRWTHTATGELRTPFGECLDVPAYDPSQPLVVYACNGGANQRWEIRDGGEIRSGVGGMCLDMNGNDLASLSTVAAPRVGIYTCNARLNQRFAFRGALYAGTPGASAGSCLTADSAGVLSIASCGGGSIMNSAGTPLIVRGGSSTQNFTYTPRLTLR